MPIDHFFFDRDVSWLSFNERVLMEAQRKSVPLFERINFLSIFSSNLDEFYRVRMPALNALRKLHRNDKLDSQAVHKHPDVLGSVRETVNRQQDAFGRVLKDLIPELHEIGIEFIYGVPIPPEIMPEITRYFFSHVLGFLKPVILSDGNARFFPGNNRLYFAAIGRQGRTSKTLIINIPTEHLPRLLNVVHNGRQYITFLDDIIRAHLRVISGMKVANCFSFKVTRDAEIDLGDEYQEDMAEMIERQLAKRDQAFATRFLCEPGVPRAKLGNVLARLGLPETVVMEGGRYHNLKDLTLNSFNVPGQKYQKLTPIDYGLANSKLLLDQVLKRDILLHTPYHAYDTVLRFFNEAAIREDVEHIYLTIYRVANDSRILHALLSAAANRKKVTVLIELKARFDEANNIMWAKKLKRAGVEVLYSRNDLKVHAKIGLIKLKNEKGARYLGLLSTGNLNESTARFYTDHVMLTSHAEILKELKNVFTVFERKARGKEKARVTFRHLLVAQYNLQEKFLQLIEREISHAKKGLPARIIIKLNNLEERVLISKLYDASNAGVTIELIVRSICCLVPGVPGMSENITVRRIVDRYLEHGRVYIFHNNGQNDIFLGSADWMNRNIYKRIEVCFPVYIEERKKEILDIIDLQLKDNEQAVLIDRELKNVPVPVGPERIQSQIDIYKKLSAQLLPATG